MRGLVPTGVVASSDDGVTVASGGEALGTVALELGGGGLADGGPEVATSVGVAVKLGVGVGSELSVGVGDGVGLRVTVGEGIGLL